MTDQEIYQKLVRFCAYRERCASEVKEKLKSLGMVGMKANQIQEKLRDDCFLNEERFAKVYAGGKFRIKHWGRVKISFELNRKGIPSYMIEEALKEIDRQEYSKALKKLLEKKLESSKETDILLRKQKLTTYALGKGYEPDLTRTVLDEILFINTNKKA